MIVLADSDRVAFNDRTELSASEWRILIEAKSPYVGQLHVMPLHSSLISDLLACDILERK